MLIIPLPNLPPLGKEQNDNIGKLQPTDNSLSSWRGKKF